MHSPAACALLQPHALLHHPRDTLKDLTLAGHVITITYLHKVVDISLPRVITLTESVEKKN